MLPMRTLSLVRGAAAVGVAVLVAGVAPACSSEPTAAGPAGPAPSASTDPTVPSGANDGGVVDDGAPGIALGEPIVAAPGTWTWVPFADSACANGSPTGIGVNPGAGKRLVLYLEGGGACWSALSCYTLETATYVSAGYGKKDFDAQSSTFTRGVFDRTLADNPFKDDSFVYVPYCTGDVHAGDKEVDHEGKLTKHVGRRNLDAFLKRVVPTFAGVDRVVLSGSSAGGFGAAFNFGRVQRAFGTAKRVDLVDDSGPPFPASQSAYLAEWQAAWDLASAAPPGCSACAGDPAAALPYYLTAYPKARFALLSYVDDSVIPQFYSMGSAQFSSALNELVATTFDPSSNARAFIVAGSGHTMLRSASPAASGTVPLWRWLTTMMDDTATWSTARP